MIKKQIIISIDLMSGDKGIKHNIKSAIKILKMQKNIKLILIGNYKYIKKKLIYHKINKKKYEIIHTNNFIKMNENISKDIIKNKTTSMYISIEQVKKKKAHACISSGNTAILLCISKYLLNTINNIKRPALIKEIPTKNKKKTYILDLGATISNTINSLLELTILGISSIKSIEKIKNPVIKILNIGKEENKGTFEIKKVHTILNKIKHINYKGFIEGNEIFNGETDIIICNGLIGNISLKIIEGTINYMKLFVTNIIKQKIILKTIAYIYKKYIKEKLTYINPKKYNGAILVGLKGIVIKSHGNADYISFAYSIKQAINKIKKNFIKNMTYNIQKYQNIIN